MKLVNLAIKDFLKSPINNGLLKLKEKMLQLIKDAFCWLKKPKWLNTLTFYALIYDLTITLSLFIFHYFGLFDNEPTSARYMLSALVQSEAAIIAIVITLSLVAVQLAAQSYSARTIETFKKTPDLWILIGIYITTMIFGLVVLKQIEAKQGYDNSSNLGGYISFSLFLGIFAFVALIPYIWRTLELLKPSSAIGWFKEKIIKENILSNMKEDQGKSGQFFITDMKKDPIQPIVDIIIGSLMKYDYETVRDGLRAIRDQTNLIFEDKTIIKWEKFQGGEDFNVAKHIFTHLKRIGIVAIKREDEDSTLEVISCLYSTGKKASENKLEGATLLAAKYLGEVGEEAANSKLKTAALEAANLLGLLGGNALSTNQIYAKDQIIKSLLKIGIKAIENDIEEAATMAAVTLGTFAFQPDEDVAYSLGLLGKAAAEKNIENTAMEAVISLRLIGEMAAKAENDGTAWESLRSLELIGKPAIEKEFHKVVVQLIITLGVIKVLAAKKNLKETSLAVVHVFNYLGLSANSDKKNEIITPDKSPLDAELFLDDENDKLENKPYICNIGLHKFGKTKCYSNDQNSEKKHYKKQCILCSKIIEW